MTSKQHNIKDELAELEAIAAWFEKGTELDVEEGLLKVKRGAELAKSLRARLKAVENEFREVEADLTGDGAEGSS